MIIYGLPTTGKSTAIKELRKLGHRAVDNDDLIEAVDPVYFEEKGWRDRKRSREWTKINPQLARILSDAGFYVFLPMIPTTFEAEIAFTRDGDTAVIEQAKRQLKKYGKKKLDPDQERLYGKWGDESVKLSKQFKVKKVIQLGEGEYLWPHLKEYLNM